jgi:hypothetical protein
MRQPYTLPQVARATGPDLADTFRRASREAEFQAAGALSSAVNLPDLAQVYRARAAGHYASAAAHRFTAAYMPGGTPEDLRIADELISAARDAEAGA